MREISIFGEAQSPCSTAAVLPRATNKSTPCHGLFGTKLFPDCAAEASPSPAPREKLPCSLS